MTTIQNLQNILNDNNPHNLSGAPANQKIMRILSAFLDAIASGSSSSGTGLSEATMIHAFASAEALSLGENYIQLFDSVTPQSIPVGTYIVIGQLYLLGGSDSPISIDPAVVAISPATADDQPIDCALFAAAQIQTQVAVTGPFLTVLIPATPFTLDQVMAKWRVMCLGVPTSGTLKIGVDALFIPITPA